MLKIFSLRGHPGPDPGPLSERTPPSAWRGRRPPVPASTYIKMNVSSWGTFTEYVIRGYIVSVIEAHGNAKAAAYLFTL